MLGGAVLCLSKASVCRAIFSAFERCCVRSRKKTEQMCAEHPERKSGGGGEALRLETVEVHQRPHGAWKDLGEGPYLPVTLLRGMLRVDGLSGPGRGDSL